MDRMRLRKDLSRGASRKIIQTLGYFMSARRSARSNTRTRFVTLQSRAIARRMIVVRRSGVAGASSYGFANVNSSVASGYAFAASRANLFGAGRTSSRVSRTCSRTHRTCSRIGRTCSRVGRTCSRTYRTCSRAGRMCSRTERTSSRANRTCSRAGRTCSRTGRTCRSVSAAEGGSELRSMWRDAFAPTLRDFFTPKKVRTGENSA